MANFKLFVPKIQNIEGGFQKLSSDKGNYNSLGQLVGTQYGISARFYEDIIGRPPTVADMKAITKSRATALFKKYFWDDVQGDILKNQSIAEIITDHAINAGESPIGTIVQNILVYDFKKSLTIDGDIGPKTAAVINSVNQEQLFNKIKAARAAAYKNIGGIFLNGWLDRLTHFIYSEKKLSPSGQVA